jgi:cytochrome c-type biogenesis protein CcmH
MKRRFFSRRGFFLAASVVATAAVPLSASASATTEDEIRSIEDLFVAPCCFRQQISVHDSPEAAAMRAEVRSLVMAGKTRDEIEAAFVDKYGTGILAAPPARGFFLLAYVLPAMSLVLGAIAAGCFIRRALSQHGSVTLRTTGTASSNLLHAYQDQIEKEIQLFSSPD